MFDKTKARIKQSFMPSREHISELSADFKSRLNALRADRSSSFQSALETDFEQVLSAWGIREEQIPTVMKDMYLRLICFLLPLLLGIIVFVQAETVGFLGRLTCLGLFLLVSVFGSLTTLWRLWILDNRRFVPFRRWLFVLFKE